ncbi:hypothetical protein THAR02_06295 [Trichoderma harzianum]|uniref:Uncharacterized protein n=1 Tax=Trichoderma harzianum TaxID=5544 RepID=A0A0F9ZMX6_TRIHA|nr:hypothetical protein THAR02_06295 [Trichoderma harzianum]
MAEPNSPSRERKRLQAQFARDERTIFTQIRAFFRAPATIDTLLIMNVMSKLFMVCAITFIWARTRPLGSIGRNVLAFLTVSDIGITQLLWEFNDLQFVFLLSILEDIRADADGCGRSWRLNPPQNDDVAIQTEPESIEMTRVVVQPDAAALPSSEFVGVRSLRAIEARNRRLRAAAQSDAPPVLPSFEFEMAIPRPLRQRNLHPRVADGTGVSRVVPRVSFQLPVVEVTPLDVNADVDVEVTSSLPSLDSETTPTPPDTEESMDAHSVSSLVFGAPLDFETTPKLRDLEESVEGPSEADSSSDPSLKAGIAITRPKTTKAKYLVLGPSLTSSAATTQSQAGEETVSTLEPSRRSSIATTAPESAEEQYSTSEASRPSSMATTIPEAPEERNSTSKPSRRSSVATTIPEAAEERYYTSEPSRPSSRATTIPGAPGGGWSTSGPSRRSSLATTIPDVAEVKDSASESSFESDTATMLPEVAEEKYFTSEVSRKLVIAATSPKSDEKKDCALENSPKSSTAAILRKIGKNKDIASLPSQKLDTVVTEQEVEEESPRGSSVRNFWGKFKGWGKQYNDRNNGNDQNQGNNRNNGRGWNRGDDSGQSDSNPDWDIVKENRHLLKDDASKDSSND